MLLSEHLFIPGSAPRLIECEDALSSRSAVKMDPTTHRGVQRNSERGGETGGPIIKKILSL